MGRRRRRCSDRGRRVVAHRGHRPTRTCVGCRRRFDAGRLVRCVLVGDRLALGSSSCGRGAWLCRDSACVDAAFDRGNLRRALRTSLSLSRTDLNESVLKG
ncbi:MAG: DUF448 domain-containing protein [Actinobacteria bacterium]|nr:DUF448 domain-containing protein [Actinomycetota bacterium]